MSAMADVRRTLVGRYELVDVIGRGGMGTVYRAFDRVLGRPVAVKLLAGPVADHDPASVARFEREARAAAALSHPAIVAVYDTGADDGTLFIVMELIAGRSLEEILRADGSLDPLHAIGIAARVADALAVAHAAGIVHRDIKPANVMVAGDGAVKVLDFGIARAVGGTTLTLNASILGTAAYMSPEQALGKVADERSDIYALGCVLYAMLAGGPPFTGDVAAVVLHQQATVAPRPLRPERPRVSRELEALVLQMLAKLPDDRPQTTTDVRDRLTALAAPPPPVASTVRMHPTAATQRLGTAPSKRRDRAVLALALVAAVVMFVVVALALGGGSPRPSAGALHKSKTSTSPARKQGRSAQTTTTPAGRSSTTRSGTTTAVHHRADSGTVSATAGALTALTTQDVQSGAIDQQAAQQISNGLTNVLNSYDAGNAANAQQQLTNLSQQVTMLEQQEHITGPAAAALNHAVTKLNSALLRAPTITIKQPGGHPPGQSGQPTKHGGAPPGQAKKAH